MLSTGLHFASESTERLWHAAPLFGQRPALTLSLRFENILDQCSRRPNMDLD